MFPSHARARATSDDRPKGGREVTSDTHEIYRHLPATEGRDDRREVETTHGGSDGTATEVERTVPSIP